ncbi:CHAT domain-containing protein [Kalaharituber pfeilii]|nr:CHAT domain-containing protein [Kalaharituber pfeilii]
MDPIDTVVSTFQAEQAAAGISLTKFQSAREIARITLIHSYLQTEGDDGVVFQRILDLCEYGLHHLEDIQDSTEQAVVQAEIFASMGNFWIARCQRTNSYEHFKEAIFHIEKAVQTIPSGNPRRADYLARFGQLLSSRHRMLGELSDLDGAIRCGKEAIAITSPGDPRYPQYLFTLSNHLEDRYKLTLDLSDLEASLIHAREALELFPTSDPERFIHLHNYGLLLHRKYQGTQTKEALDHAINAFEDALKVTPIDHPERIVVLSNSATALKDRYSLLLDPKDLKIGIARATEAVTLGPGHYDRHKHLSNLAMILIHSYRATQLDPELDLALSCAEESLKLTPEKNSRRVGGLVALATGMEAKYFSTLNLDDLQRAILAMEEAVLLTPNCAVRQPNVAYLLGGLLNWRYEHTRSLADLDAAAAILKEVIDGNADIPTKSVIRARCFQALASSYANRATSTGKTADFDSAVDNAELAVRASLEDLPLHASCLLDLSVHLNSRYEATMDIADLEGAIARAQEAISATPAGQRSLPIYAKCIGHLAGFLQARHKRMGNPEDLERAMTLGTDAANPSGPVDGYLRFCLLSNLATMMRDKYFTKSGTLSDLEAAIGKAKQAIESVPNLNHPDAAAVLNNLAVMQGHYAALMLNDATPGSDAELKNLEEAITNAQNSVDVCPDNDRHYATFLVNLAISLYRRYLVRQNIDDLKRVLESYHGAWCCLSAPLPVRLQAALLYAGTFITHPQQDFTQVETVLRKAVELIPVATSRSLGRGDQQHILEKLSKMSSIAAAVSLEVGRSPFEALRLLEIGRCVTSGHLLDYRSDISELTSAYPEVAARFETLCAEADSPERANDVRRRKQMFRELDEVIAEIRRLPKFEGFLQTVSEKEMTASVAANGPIVILNVTELRSDAIIVTRDSIQSLPLPSLEYRAAESYIHDLNQAIQNISKSTQGQINEKLRAVWLPWLWQAAVCPVLQALGLVQTAASGDKACQRRKLGRLWWIGVGLMATAPLHAAGLYGSNLKPGKAPESTLKYCIPSYTPTIRALLYSRQTAAQRAAGTQVEAALVNEAGSLLHRHNLLIVSMPTTPGEDDLNVEEETSQIEALVPSCRVLQRPNVTEVLRELPRSTMAHFACHGIANSRNPSESALLLVKHGAADEVEQADALSVERIASLRLSTARVAYLSACSTAELNANSKILDEVVHIASSFQLAGFRHVIGSLWQTDDKACIKMATEFYRLLVEGKNGAHNPSNFDIARAYREAILKTRKDFLLRPLSWAPYMHLGA